MFAIARVTPGPGSMITTLIGWKVAGLPGALVATLALFVPACMVCFSSRAPGTSTAAPNGTRRSRKGLRPVAGGLVVRRRRRADAAGGNRAAVMGGGRRRSLVFVAAAEDASGLGAGRRRALSMSPPILRGLDDAVEAGSAVQARDGLAILSPCERVRGSPCTRLFSLSSPPAARSWPAGRPGANFPQPSDRTGRAAGAWFDHRRGGAPAWRNKRAKRSARRSCRQPDRRRHHCSAPRPSRRQRRTATRS